MIEIVWLTDSQNMAPHYRECAYHNPEVVQHLYVSPPFPSRLEGWRNCDRNLRRWWIENQHRVHAPYVLFIEYDVRINDNIMDHLRPQEGAGVVSRRHPNQSWFFFNELHKMPKFMERSAMAVVPMAVTLWDRESLDKICNPFFDGFFNRLDLFSELRIGTILNLCEIPHYLLGLNHVHFRERPVVGKGIFHPVKKSTWKKPQ